MITKIPYNIWYCCTVKQIDIVLTNFKCWMVDSKTFKFSFKIYWNKYFLVWNHALCFPNGKVQNMTISFCLTYYWRNSIILQISAKIGRITVKYILFRVIHKKPPPKLNIPEFVLKCWFKWAKIGFSYQTLLFNHSILNLRWNVQISIVIGERVSQSLDLLTSLYFIFVRDIVLV